MTEIDNFSFRLEFLVPFVARRRRGEYTSLSHRKGRAWGGKLPYVRDQLHGPWWWSWFWSWLQIVSVGTPGVGKNVRSVMEQERGR